MSMVADGLNRIRTLDDLSRSDSPIHTLHPAAAILATAGFVVAVMSFGRYEVSALMPFFLYPVVVLSLSRTPLAAIGKPLLLIEPFILCIGILNPLFDSQPVVVGGVAFARGWLVFLSIAVKCGLAVTAALLLTATHGADGIASGLRTLGVPRFFVLLLLMTFRYIWLLLDEAARMTRAYSLRDPRRKRIRFGDLGAFVGGLLLRSFGRAERVYQAMLLRGFDGEPRMGRGRSFRTADAAYVAGWWLLFVALRFGNPAGALGALFQEWFR